MSNIYLVGFMGTGKTAVGRERARKLKWRFLDLDDLIELREGRRICDIFANDGERYFRRIERAVLKDAAAQKKFVVACGGGVVINPENIRIMKEAGVIIGLSASLNTILKRTRKAAHRPLLNVEDPRKKIEHLLKLRAPYYTQADKTIDTSKCSIAEVVAKLFKLSEVRGKSKLKSSAAPKPKRKKKRR